MDVIEKLDNYKLQQTLLKQKSGPFLLTIQQKTWLREVLDLPEATIFLSNDELVKLKALLSNYQTNSYMKYVIEKCPRCNYNNKKSKWFEVLKQIITDELGMKLSVQTNGGKYLNKISGVPFHFEYSMSRREWYLLWWRIELGRVMKTPFRAIKAVEPFTVEQYKSYEKDFLEALNNAKKYLEIEVLDNTEDVRRRVLYAFSCFEKKIDYIEKNNYFKLIVYYFVDEEEYLLRKIRFFGKRIKIIAPKDLQKRMFETAKRAYERYR